MHVCALQAGTCHDGGRALELIFEICIATTIETVEPCCHIAWAPRASPAGVVHLPLNVANTMLIILSSRCEKLAIETGSKPSFVRIADNMHAIDTERSRGKPIRI